MRAKHCCCWLAEATSRTRLKSRTQASASYLPHHPVRPNRREGAARLTLGASAPVRRSRRVSEAALSGSRAPGAARLLVAERLCPCVGRTASRHHRSAAADSAPPHRRFAEQGSKLQATGILGEEDFIERLVLLVNLRVYTFPLDIRALQNDAEIG